MKSNSGTKITLRAILVIGVVFLAVGVLTSNTNETVVADTDTVVVATAEEDSENIEFKEIRNVRHSITDNTVTSRSSTSSRFENEVIRQIEEEEEKQRLEAERMILSGKVNEENKDIFIERLKELINPEGYEIGNYDKEFYEGRLLLLRLLGMDLTLDAQVSQLVKK